MVLLYKYALLRTGLEKSKIVHVDELFIYHGLRIKRINS